MFWNEKTEKVTIPCYVLKMSIFNFANHNLLIAKYSALVLESASAGNGEESLS